MRYSQKLIIFIVFLIGLIVIYQNYMSNYSPKRSPRFKYEPLHPDTDDTDLTPKWLSNVGDSQAKFPAGKLTADELPSEQIADRFRIQPKRPAKRIVVTGGAGFVGSHLVDVLMNQGHYVTVLDNLFTGNRENIDQWMKHPRFEFIPYDVSNPIYLEADQIYHLASPASPPNYMANPIKTLKANLLGTINLLGLARRTGATFLLASTSEVYGDPEVHPQSESYWGNVNPNGVRSCYDEGKRGAESLAYAYFRREGVPVRVARIFNTYGPRMQFNDGRVVSNFILQALSNKDMCIYGNGNFTRSFMYISDLVEGLIRLMNSNIADPVNLGNPHECTIYELAVIVKSLTNSSSSIINCPEATDDPKRRQPDVTRAKTLLDWEPKIQLKEGLQLTINAFREALKNSSLQVRNPNLERRMLHEQ